MKVYIGKNEEVTGYDIVLIPEKNLYTGRNAFIDHFGEITSLEDDVLNLAAGVYATDLAVKRAELENYIRDIEFTIEVVNIHAFERIHDLLAEALYTLSCDNWVIKFIHVAGSSESLLDIPVKDGVVLLFSGGLDSLCGAAYYAAQQTPLCLVSHINTNRVTSTAQETLYKAIKDHFIDSIVTRNEFRVNARKFHELPFPEEREDSQRTRSFLFLSLAALTARRSGYQKVISIAENGQFAIHLPLSPARVGPFSTHTADPKFVHQAEALFKILLGLDALSIENPFIYLTKAEILSHFPTELHVAIPDSVSCWKASRIDKNHCGVCIPCFTRRIALEHHGIKLNEYGTDLFKQKIEKLAPDDEGKRNIGDFLGFITTFNEVYKRDASELLYHFPELINEHFDYAQACAMYFRMTEQALGVFDNYPQLKKMLS
jgi:7-cyano-7-deazaguanine synthase in queuosine biosynthesis